MFGKDTSFMFRNVAFCKKNSTFAQNLGIVAWI
jgi:hypothetical protein